MIRDRDTGLNSVLTQMYIQKYDKVRKLTLSFPKFEEPSSILTVLSVSQNCLSYIQKASAKVLAPSAIP